MANQNITTKETISQLNDADTLLVVQNSKLRRISKKNAYGDEVSQLKEAIADLRTSDIAGGKNKLGCKVRNGIYQSNNGILSDTTNKQYASIEQQLKKGTYTFSMSSTKANGGGFIRAWGKSQGQLLASQTSTANPFPFTFTLNADDTIFMTFVEKQNGTTIDYDFDSLLQIELGTQATTFEPYIMSNKQLTQSANAQTDLKMLGWTVPVECPIQNSYANGVFTQKVGRVDLGSLSWEYQAEGTRFHSLSISSLVKASINNSTIPNAFTTAYEVATPGDTWNIKNNVVSIGTNKAVLIRDTSYTDATTFKNSLQGQYLYYELATPIIKNIDGNEVVSEIQNKLSIKATENAWAGSQLKFSLPKNNVKIYELTAISLVSDCVKTNFIIRADGTIIKKDFGYATTLSYDSNGILTVDFAKSTYWCYNLVEMSSNY